MKKIFVSLAMAVVLATSAFAGEMVTVRSISKTSWTENTTKTVENNHTGRHVGSAAAGLWILGPVGGLAAYAISKGASDNEGSNAKTTSETVHGYRVKLSNGEVIRTGVLYKVGQRIDRDQIDVE